MDQIPSPLPSPAVYDHPSPHPHLHTPSSHHHPHHTHHPLSAAALAAAHPKLLASFYHPQQGFLHPALSHAYGLALPDPFRPRSGSLLSLGSTGSSHRPERSPSRESTSSHDSLTRASPLGYFPESPSPSPPNEASKLFGLLKGTVSSPYNSLFSKTGSSSREKNSSEYMRRGSYDMTVGSALKRQASYDDVIKKPPPPLISAPELARRSFTLSCPPGTKRSQQEGPMDLSVKPKRPRLDINAAVAARGTSAFPAPNGSETVTRGRSPVPRSASLTPLTISTPILDTACRPPPPVLEPISPPSRAPSRDSVMSSGDESSILRSILCGGGINSLESNNYPSRPASVKSDASGFVCPSSPAAMSEPASPSNNILSRLMAGSPCNVEANQRVGIAKKTLFPVRARVTYWLAKTLKYAKSLPEFSSLSNEDQVILVVNSWAKILLLYMAENNFEFAVSQVVEPLSDTGNDDNASGGNPEVPTMRAVEKVQGFIQKCHQMALDAKEYAHCKTAVLFQTGTTGLKEKSLVEQASSSARMALQKHIQEARPSDKARYPSVLMRLHALSGINTKMIEHLFCKHITSKVSMDDYLKDLLFEQPASNDDKQ